MLYAMPNIELLAPRDYADLHSMFDYAVNTTNGPVAIRYPRASEKKLTSVPNEKGVESQQLAMGSDVSFFPSVP